MEKNNILITFSAILGGIGFILSLVVTIVANVSLTKILIQPFLSALIMGGLGVGIFYFLKWKTPEVFDESLLNESENDTSNIPSNDVESQQDSTSDFNEEISDIPGSSGGANKNKAAKEGEILVEGVPIKNDPAVMAEAVQNVLDKDSDEENPTTFATTK